MAPGRGMQAQSGLETQSPKRWIERFVAGFMSKLQFGLTSTSLDFYNFKSVNSKPKIFSVWRFAYK